MKHTFRLPFALAIAAAISLTAPAAFAKTAANTQILNTATLSYFDGASTKQSSSTVTVTVSLVPSGVDITPGPNQTTTYNGPTTKLTNSFIVTATANGPDTYNVTTAISAFSNTGAPNAATATALTTSLTLGATVTVAGSTTAAIVVPADGNASDGLVNGIAANSTVFINGEERDVLSIVDNATGTSTITLKAALTTAPGAGVLVAGRKVVNVDVTAGTIVTTGQDITIDKTLTVTSTSTGNPSKTSAAIRDTFTSGAANLAKYVRNVTKPSGSGTPYVYSSTNYYRSGVSAAPGDTLEYILVAINTTATPVTASVVNDNLPIAYATLKANAYGSGKEITYVSDTGAVSTYSAAADTDQATYNAGSGQLTVYVGTGATSSAGGSIPLGSVLVLYQLVVNP